MVLSYNGKAYNGWQAQRNAGARTIQSTVQDCFFTLMRNQIELVGCGRTDAGVNARDYVAHFDAEDGMKTEQIVYKLNKILPPDICIQSIKIVHDDAHARFDASSRTYVYSLHTFKSPFLPFSFHYKYQKPCITSLQEAAQLLMEYDDFTPFCKTGTDNLTMICHISSAIWTQRGDIFQFSITADRFLRGMIRLIVGMCLNVDRNRLAIEEVKYAMENKIRLSEDWSVPPEGLMLQNITYPFNFL